LAPAYDITYPHNLKYKIYRKGRALSINNKRTAIHLNDVLAIAELYAIKNPKKIIQEVQSVLPLWKQWAKQEKIPEFAIEAINKEFSILLE
jgi:hypothetical protein